MCICLWPEFDCPEVTLCGWQDIKIQLLLLLHSLLIYQQGRASTRLVWGACSYCSSRWWCSTSLGSHQLWRGQLLCFWWCRPTCAPIVIRIIPHGRRSTLPGSLHLWRGQLLQLWRCCWPVCTLIIVRIIPRGHCSTPLGIFRLWRGQLLQLWCCCWPA